MDSVSRMAATTRRRSSMSSEPATDSTLDSWPRIFAVSLHMNACGGRIYAARAQSQRLETSRDIQPSKRWSGCSRARRSAVEPVTEEIAPERLVAIVRTRGPGELTASGVGAILEAGVELIKIFPAVRLGPGYLRDLLGPFPQLRPLPTGGIDFSNAAEFMQAGAFALGIGSALTDGTGRSGLAGVTARTKRLKRLLAGVDGR